MRGLIVHELGHHRYNAGPEGLAVWKEAGTKRLQRLHNLVCDEHLERNLRSLDSAWGDDLKRLGAWAFQHAQRPMPVLQLVRHLGAQTAPTLVGAPLAVARDPVQVGVGLRSLLQSMEANGSSFGRFFRALRMGLGDRFDDPKVREALALFGKKFRSLDNRGLWEVTQKLAALFGDDVGILDLVDLHETTRGEETVEADEGITDREVQEAADEIERTRSEDDPRPHPSLHKNLGSDLDFDRIDHIVRLDYDAKAHALLARNVARPARQLRQVLERLGLTWVIEKPRIRGSRLDKSRMLALATRRDPRVLAARRRIQRADLFLGVVVDCSGSMAGDRMDRARSMAALLAEACRGVPGVDLRLFGFTDSVIYDAGDAVRPAAHALVAGGGNNDAAALWYAATTALTSRRSARLLVMISDGLPTECTVESLRQLVRRLVRKRGIPCTQIAVAPISDPCFDHYVDVTDDDPDRAVRAFGRVVARLVTTSLGG